MQSFLIGALRRRFSLSEDVLVINGAVARAGTRKARVDMFQERGGFDVMVLSPRAGGVGLTLTAANHVIHLSRWWNPAVEDQCTDRVFRIGQRRTVHVYLPIARHPEFGDYSFDIKLDSLMEGKREMNRRVLAPTAATKEDVRGIYDATITAGAWRRLGRMTYRETGSTWTCWSLRPSKSGCSGTVAEAAGYDTRRTPQSHDCGADGLAISRAGGDQHTILVQCKHTQPDAKCGPGRRRGSAAVQFPAYEGRDCWRGAADGRDERGRLHERCRALGKTEGRADDRPRQSSATSNLEVRLSEACLSSERCPSDPISSTSTPISTALS